MRTAKVVESTFRSSADVQNVWRNAPARIVVPIRYERRLNRLTRASFVQGFPLLLRKIGPVGYRSIPRFVIHTAMSVR